MRVAPIFCYSCKNKGNYGMFHCEAFRDKEIPLEIITGDHDHDHTTPYPGDNGIQFEPITEEP